MVTGVIRVPTLWRYTVAECAPTEYIDGHIIALPILLVATAVLMAQVGTSRLVFPPDVEGTLYLTKGLYRVLRPSRLSLCAPLCEEHMIIMESGTHTAPPPLAT